MMSTSRRCAASTRNSRRCGSTWPRSPQARQEADITAIDPIRSVLNQAQPLADYDAFSSDPALVDAVGCYDTAWALGDLRAAGRRFATSEILAQAALANDHPPILHTHDRHGHRRDEVEFHPAWHRLLATAVETGLVALPWDDPPGAGQVVRGALFYLFSQAEAGTQCPIAMSFGAVPVLSKAASQHPAIDELWLPGLLSRRYDPRLIPATAKEGVLFGMGMTERQGGSDVRKNITVGEPVGDRGAGRPYRITGHKWFLSAPTCDAFLVLAQAEGGISCFLMPQFREDGSRNAIRIQRLKDKLGNRSNASSEVEFHGADAILISEEGRGVPTIIEMATYTRVDCVLAAAGMQRRALAVALDHAAQREAFGKRLAEQPLMRKVLVDLAVEAEAATHLAIYLAACYEPDAADEDRLTGRLLTPAAKFHLGKRAPCFAAEAMEVIGGNGYVEDQDLPRIYRELPLLSIWEGSGNVMCLDVLRTLGREPRAAEVFLDRVRRSGGEQAALGRAVGQLAKLLEAPAEASGRAIAESLSLCMQGALLVERAPASVAAAFCESRFGEDRRGMSFGTQRGSCASDEILERASPRAA